MNLFFNLQSQLSAIVIQHLHIKSVLSSKKSQAAWNPMYLISTRSGSVLYNLYFWSQMLFSTSAHFNSPVLTPLIVHKLYLQMSTHLLQCLYIYKFLQCNLWCTLKYTFTNVCIVWCTFTNVCDETSSKSNFCKSRIAHQVANPWVGNSEGIPKFLTCVIYFSQNHL